VKTVALKQLRYIFSVTSGATPESGKAEYWDGNLLWATPEDVSAADKYWLRDTRRKITLAGYQSCGTSLAPAGAIVLTKRAPIGQVAVLAKEACSNQGCFLLTPRQQTDTRFFYYWLSAQANRLQVLGRGSTFMELSTDELKSLRAPHPLLLRQSEIADYLDCQTARLDGLVAAKEQVFQLLAEKRRAVISHVVTRGLDPAFPLRESEVPWLGKIPEHWKTRRVAWLFKERDERGEPDLPLLEVSINAGVVLREFSDDKIESTAADFNTYKVARKGDIVFNKMRMWQISGTNFGSTQGTSTVTFNGTTGTPTSWSASSITVPVPSGASSGSVVVTVGGWPSNAVSFTVVPTPNISSLSPTSGPVGTSVTITGTNFGASQGSGTVSFNGTTGTPTSWSATSIAVPVPNGASTGNVVISAGGVSSNGVSFTVLPTPNITSLSPTSGPIGTPVVISGTNFGAIQGTSTVTFNGTSAAPTTWNATSIGAPVPNGASTGNLVVTVNGVPSSGVSFAVTPNITSLSPTSGPIGTSVTVAGTSFGSTQGTSIVTFNGTNASPTAWSDTSIVTPVPSGATAGNVVVTVNGFASNGVHFTVDTTIMPALQSISVTPATTSVAAGSANYGIELDIKYQVLDQDTHPLESASMIPHEQGTFFDGLPLDSDIGPTPGYPTSTHTTASDGTFHDVPFGLCSNLPINDPGRTATQNITMIKDKVSYAVRSQTWTVKAPGSASFGHGTIVNNITSPGTGSDISKSR
jgi:restriction endonuclease S subunit